MENKYIVVHGVHYQIYRKFKPNSILEIAMNHYGAERVCRYYNVDKIIRDHNGHHFLVNEIKEAHIISEDEGN